jgi:Flp pilus assembly protein TadB
MGEEGTVRPPAVARLHYGQVYTPFFLSMLWRGETRRKKGEERRGERERREGREERARGERRERR